MDTSPGNSFLANARGLYENLLPDNMCTGGILQVVLTLHLANTPASSPWVVIARNIISLGTTPCVPTFCLPDIMHMTISPVPFLSVYANCKNCICKLQKLEVVIEGLVMGLSVSEDKLVWMKNLAF